MNFLFRMVTGQYRLIWLCAIVYSALFNFSFFKHFTDAFPTSDGNTGFLISVVVFLIAAHALVFSILGGRLFTKLVLIIGFLIGASAAYFSWTYGIVVDTVMLRNIAETDSSEAFGLLSVELVMVIVLGALVPAYLVYKAPVGYQGILKEIRAKLFSIMLAIVMIAAALVPYSANYASFFREYKSVRFYSAPLFPLYSVGKYFGKSNVSPLKPESEMINVAPDAKIEHSDPNKHDLIVLIVGETGRADHFSLNGYKRQTNPRLSKRKGVISFSHMTSCGTSTAVSVPCMFSPDSRDEFDSKSIYNELNALDTLHENNVAVLWRDNNSSSKGVAERVDYQSFKSSDLNTICDPECRDTGMLVGLDDYVDKHPNQDIVIVLHAMGSHGPEYFKRYPQVFEQFTPVCKSNQLAKCSSDEIINAYDNTMLFTDFFIDSSIDWLDQYSGQYKTALLYVSDHGESLGENDVYLHGMPFAFAPEVQKHVAAVAWLNDSSTFKYQDVVKNKEVPFTQDNFYCSVLSLLDVNTEFCPHEKSIFFEHNNKQE
ncbi:phosphoethanolamine transferase [Vibrio breoganii]|uniref:phosphoethanolamine transferase n=1 Tax=Vibrio breoganii TaxID=553239 RepID=UPI00080E3DDB|nr:phosphoethanolamine--lipid A transferase [Vibrio breoganii]OCH73448.1 phosphoethanolamine transferase [Vibrio breoganii]PML24750.1 phosphoethanolamine transferase [Vibrio breoganii]